MDFLNLPIEVLQHIFGFLDHKSRLTALQVCHQWNALASTAQFVDRIWFRMSICELKLERQMAALKCSSRKYRHIVIDCETSRFSPLSVHQSPMLKIAETLTAVNNVETLVFFTFQNTIATELLMLLQNVPNLRRLCLLGYKDYRLHETCFSSFPIFKYGYSNRDQTSWLDIFTEQSGLVLQNVTDVTLTGVNDFNVRVDVFQQMFPNLNQLQVTVNDASIVCLIDAYNNQLEKLSICSKSSALLALFCDLNFQKLSQLYLITDCVLEGLIVTKYVQFFENPDHCRNLRRLKLFLTNASIIETIYSNCTSMRVLEVLTTNTNFFENISIPWKLKKLSIGEHYYDHSTKIVLPYSWYTFKHDANLEEVHSSHPVHVSDHCQPIQSLNINGFYRPSNELPKLLRAIAPNLEVLALEDICQPEEALRILSETSPNIRHLKLSYTYRVGMAPRLNFGYLMGKINLVTYSLENVQIDADSIPKWIQMAPNLHTTLIVNCKTLIVSYLAILGSCCPKLKQIKLKGCKRITAQGLKEIKQSLPHVTIIYQEK